MNPAKNADEPTFLQGFGTGLWNNSVSIVVVAGVLAVGMIFAVPAAGSEEMPETRLGTSSGPSQAGQPLGFGTGGKGFMPIPNGNTSIVVGPGTATGQQNAAVSASFGAGARFVTRVGGAFATVGGLFQSAVGGLTVFASGIGTALSGGTAAPATIPLAILGSGVAVHGLDQVWTVWTGTNQRPYAAQALDTFTGNPTASDFFNSAAGVAATLGAGAATRGLAAGVANGLAGSADEIAGATNTIQVTSWAEKGITPDLASGRWVQVGGPTILNYINTGLYGGKFDVVRSSSFPWVSISGKGLNAPLSNYISSFLEQTQLMWPQGWEVAKGILGQRIIK